LANGLKTVVVPIGPVVSENKLSIINLLNDNFIIHVHLLILVDRHDDPHMIQSTLVKVFRVLRSKSSNNISYDIVKTNDKGKNIVSYCDQVKADLVIVHPNSETKVGWFNKQIPDILPANSRTQVLTVRQQNL
jgi:hypothetical protein